MLLTALVAVVMLVGGFRLWLPSDMSLGSSFKFLKTPGDITVPVSSGSLI